MKKHSIPKGLVIAFLALSCIVCIIIAILSFSKREKICQRLRTSNYNCVFLSMFPIDTFQEEDFSYFRAEDVLKLTEVISNYQTLKSFVKAVSRNVKQNRLLRGKSIVFADEYLSQHACRLSLGLIMYKLRIYPFCRYEMIIHLYPPTSFAFVTFTEPRTKTYWSAL